MEAIREVPISEEETGGGLFDKLAVVGAQLCVEAMTAIETGTATRTPQNHEEATHVSMISKEFGNIDWNDADNVRRQILEIPGMVSRDEQYQNAMRNSDKQEARTESDRVLQKVIFSIMADNMELFKQYTDNKDFKKWLSDLVFNVTYNKAGQPYVGRTSQ